MDPLTRCLGSRCFLKNIGKLQGCCNLHIGTRLEEENSQMQKRLIYQLILLEPLLSQARIEGRPLALLVVIIHSFESCFLFQIMLLSALKGKRIYR